MDTDLLVGAYRLRKGVYLKRGNWKEGALPAVAGDPCGWVSDLAGTTLSGYLTRRFVSAEAKN